MDEIFKLPKKLAEAANGIVQLKLKIKYHKRMKALLKAWDQFKLDYVHEDYSQDEKDGLMFKFIEKVLNGDFEDRLGPHDS